MRVPAILAAALMLLMSTAAQSWAATVIFYSSPENTYGWCAGYSYSRGESCARGNCEEYGGEDCQVAVECDGGWGAAAFADGPQRGFGAACGYRSAVGARSTAIITCVNANGTLCWTSDAFDANGRRASERSNLDFDSTFYAQGLLSIAGYDPGEIDGQMGSKTRAAIRAFETDMGFKATGEANPRLVSLLLYAIHGSNRVAKAMENGLFEDDRDYIFSYAANAAPNFSTELANLEADEQRTALAVAMTASSTKCTVPAQSVELINGDTEGQGWNVGCAEGEYTVIFGDGVTVVTPGFSDSTPPPQQKPSQVLVNTPNPTLNNN